MRQVFMAICLNFLCLVMLTDVNASQMGRTSFDLLGGKRGIVPFPHKKHQDEVETCTTCHDLLPKRIGALEIEISAGRLKAKQVMNKICVKCHKKLKKEGKPFGPISCSKCHRKP